MLHNLLIYIKLVCRIFHFFICVAPPIVAKHAVREALQRFAAVVGCYNVAGWRQALQGLAESVGTNGTLRKDLVLAVLRSLFSATAQEINAYIALTVALRKLFPPARGLQVTWVSEAWGARLPSLPPPRAASGLRTEAQQSHILGRGRSAGANNAAAAEAAAAAAAAVAGGQGAEGARIEGTWYRPAPDGLTPSWPPSEGTVMLYLHGGGFQVGSSRMHARFMGDVFRRYARAAAAPASPSVAAAAAAGGSLSVFSVEYGLAPAHRWPTQLQQALAAYAWLATRQGCRRILLGGDSAGGNLALALALCLRDAAHGDLPQPIGVVAFSPWTNLAINAATRQRPQADDFITMDEGRLRRLLANYLGPRYADLALHAHVSPYFSDLEGLPPLWICAGGSELLLHDIEAFAAKAGAQGTDVQLLVGPGQFHVYPLSGPSTGDPAAAEALNAMARWVARRCVAAAAAAGAGSTAAEQRKVVAVGAPSDCRRRAGGAAADGVSPFGGRRMQTRSAARQCAAASPRSGR